LSEPRQKDLRAQPFGCGSFAKRAVVHATSGSSTRCQGGRALRRPSAPGTDIGEAFKAHHALFRASAAAVGRHVEEQTRLYLPCGPGLLICEALRASTPSGLVYVFRPGRTWIADNMVRADQQSIAAAPTGMQSQLTIMTMMALKQAE
jgi:hypothetical protein